MLWTHAEGRQHQEAPQVGPNLSSCPPSEKKTSEVPTVLWPSLNVLFLFSPTTSSKFGTLARTVLRHVAATDVTTAAIGQGRQEIKKAETSPWEPQSHWLIKLVSGRLEWPWAISLWPSLAGKQPWLVCLPSLPSQVFSCLSMCLPLRLLPSHANPPPPHCNFRLAPRCYRSWPTAARPRRAACDRAHIGQGWTR